MLFATENPGDVSLFDNLEQCSPGLRALIEKETVELRRSWQLVSSFLKPCVACGTTNNIGLAHSYFGKEPDSTVWHLAICCDACRLVTSNHEFLNHAVDAWNAGHVLYLSDGEPNG